MHARTHTDTHIEDPSFYTPRTHTNTRAHTLYRSLHELMEHLDEKLPSEDSQDEKERIAVGGGKEPHDCCGNDLLGMATCALDGSGSGDTNQRGTSVRTLDKEVARGKKGYNHHARANFDRARAFALQGQEEAEYIAQHPMLSQVPPS